MSWVGAGRCISKVDTIFTIVDFLEFCRELSLEEKSLALLGRIDFGQEFKKVKKEEDGTKKEEKEKEIVQQWPWQGLVEHLGQAHQELAIILDMITHVRFLNYLPTFVCCT